MLPDVPHHRRHLAERRHQILVLTKIATAETARIEFSHDLIQIHSDVVDLGTELCELR